MHCSKLFEQLKYDERCQHPLTYQFLCVSSTSKWSPQSGVGWEDVSWLSDWQTALLQRLTKTRVFNTTQKPNLSFKTVFLTHAQLNSCVSYVHKLQTTKPNPRCTKCTHVCCCLGWPWRGKKGTFSVEKHAKSTPSTIPIHLSPLRWESAERRQAKWQERSFSSCWHVPRLLQRQFSKCGACSQYCSWCRITGQLRIQTTSESHQEGSNSYFFSFSFVLMVARVFHKIFHSFFSEENCVFLKAEGWILARFLSLSWGKTIVHGCTLTRLFC